LPVRTYVHCEHGMDRTGQVLMSYEMRYLGRSWKQVLTYSNAVGARPVQPENRCAAQWYCFYLYYVEKMPLLDCAWSPPA
jgi:protein-tyrosine phosphatase